MVITCEHHEELSIMDLAIKLAQTRSIFNIGDLRLAHIIYELSQTSSGQFGDHTILRAGMSVHSVDEIPHDVMTTVGSVYLCTHSQFRGYNKPLDQLMPRPDFVICGVQCERDCPLRN